MSEYPEAEFFKEFVYRTKCNLEIIEKVSKESVNEAYEVTQLLNSLLGLLILPKERYYARLSEVIDKEVPVFQKCRCQIKGKNITTINYQQAIRHLRNAAAHPDNIEFHSEDKTIMKIVLKDQDNFIIKLSISDLKDLVFELCGVLINKFPTVEGL